MYGMSERKMVRFYNNGKKGTESNQEHKNRKKDHMFQSIAISIALRLIQASFSQFFTCVNEADDCPDGICDDALRALDDLDNSTPNVSIAPGKVRAFDFGSINWSELKPLADSVVAMLAALKAFLGLSHRVGD